MTLIIIILGAAIIFQEDSFVEPVFLSASLIFGELLHRACLFLAEIDHGQTRYRRKWDIVKSTFSFRDKNTFIFMATVIFLRKIYTGFKIPLGLNNANGFLQKFLSVVWLYFVVRLQALSPVEESEIRETGCDAGEALAWHYYFGYLKLVLPRLEEAIAKSNHFRYKIFNQKLFILLPRHCHAYNDITVADVRIKWAGNLPELLRNRSGIKAYSFKHSVYRIEMPRPDGNFDEYHCVMEYAMPLQSLYDMSCHSDASVSRQELDHQVNVNLLNSFKQMLRPSY